MKRMIRYLAVAFLPFVLVHESYGSTTDESGPTEIDLLILSLSKSVQNHVLYLQLLDNSNDQLFDALVSGLDSDLFDLSHYLAFSNSRETITGVCEMSGNLKEEFLAISASRKDGNGSEVSEQAYKLAMICISKAKDQ